MTSILPRRFGVSILVDTGAWYALADTADRHHRNAQHFYAGCLGQDTFITTDLIVAETWSLIHAHLGRPAALAFWGGLRDAQIPITILGAVDLEAAWRIVEAVPDQLFSFVDCTTFAVMERLHIDDAFAFDSHFLIYRYGPNRQRAFRRVP